MKSIRLFAVTLLCLSLSPVMRPTSAAQQQQQQQQQQQPGRVPVIMISIDGLMPDYVLEADKRGLKIPNLRRLLKEGAFATGVVGVTPTVTYPSHHTGHWCIAGQARHRDEYAVRSVQQEHGRLVLGTRKT
jgi:predicted AlkP superfamily pyrophosphatase or phosphodiesterase